MKTKDWQHVTNVAEAMYAIKLHRKSNSKQKSNYTRNQTSEICVCLRAWAAICGSWELDLGSLQEQQVPLTTESPPSPWIHFHTYKKLAHMQYSTGYTAEGCNLAIRKCIRSQD